MLVLVRGCERAEKGRMMGQGLLDAVLPSAAALQRFCAVTAAPASSDPYETALIQNG